jgi:small subunit ribosomal protein S17
MSETQTNQPAKRQRTLIGQVVSNKMDKTVVVRVERRVKHPVLGKTIVRSNKYKAHDENNQYNEGARSPVTRPGPLFVCWKPHASSEDIVPGASAFGNTNP